MIQSLEITNIALIEHLVVKFHPGMQILAGETGAGKSIVVDSVNLALGGRADRNLIRSGAEKASVEAVFDVPGQADIQQILQREGVEYDGRTVTVWREISAGGRNICRVCGMLLPVSTLRELSVFLMDIHGQHEHQFLMDPDRHRSFLDRMGDSVHQELLARTASDCDAFLAVHRHYARLRKEQTTKLQRMERLESDLKELHDAKLKKGEEEQLVQECLRLRNAEKILSVLQNARSAISLGDTEKSCLEKIREASGLLASLRTMDPKTEELAQRCETAYYELEEIAYELQDLIEDIDMSPDRLEKAEARLDLIRRMERKYGSDIPAVLQAMEKMENDYKEICSLDDQTAETARKHKLLLSIYRASAKELTQSREKLAKEFEQRIMMELRDLGMEKTVFRVVFASKPADKHPMPRPVGDDDLEFMIAPNPGEPVKPLARTSSGGELSRLMLAIKSMEADNTGVDCMVFDEIDTGISGRMAQVVAEKMMRIAHNRQVICVSHLSQIAAAADWQYLVSKEVRNGRTFTDVKELNPEERIQEIARMISGAEGSVTDAIEYAKSLLLAAEKKRR